MSYIKYKLIKEYPASPPINTILEKRSIISSTYMIQKDCNWFPYRIEPEKYPEYYEKIIDWEAIEEKAIRDYPKGTKYYVPDLKYTSSISTSSGKFKPYESKNTIALLDCNGGAVWIDEMWGIKLKVKTYECLLCGRNKFTRKSPHNCKGGFRKHTLRWKECY